MKFKYSIPVYFAVALTVGEAAVHYKQLAQLVPGRISEAALRERLQIQAPDFRLPEVIRAMARKHNVKEAFVKSIIKAESGFRADAISNKGAVGLMQLMPGTAADMGIVDPRVPEQNVEAGTKYLGILLSRYRNHKDAMIRATAAYNAGPGWVDKYKGIPPFNETRAYVKRVMSYYQQYSGEKVAFLATGPKTKRHRNVRLARAVRSSDELAD